MEWAVMVCEGGPSTGSSPKGSLWLRRHTTRVAGKNKADVVMKKRRGEGAGLERSAVGKVRNYVRDSLSHSK